MFINIQHAGDGDPALTNFPAPQGSGKIPRDATIVITRKDGGIIGS
jgi:secreted PhoX family phosphatase